MSHNRSLDGVLDVLNSRHLTDAGPLQLIDHDDGDDDYELLPPGGNPAVAADVPGASRKRPVVRSRALALSPTGKSCGKLVLCRRLQCSGVGASVGMMQCMFAQHGRNGKQWQLHDCEWDCLCGVEWICHQPTCNQVRRPHACRLSTSAISSCCECCIIVPCRVALSMSDSTDVDLYWLGHSWAAATTEGLLIYSLDTALTFDPTDLTENLTPAAFHQAVAAKAHVRALLIALRLGDGQLLRHGIYSVPHAQVATVAAALPQMFLEPMLRGLIDCLGESPHVEFLLDWVKALLAAQGPMLQSAAGGPTAASLPVMRALQQIVNRLHQDISTACESNVYMLDYVVSAGKGHRQQQQQKHQHQQQAAAAAEG